LLGFHMGSRKRGWHSYYFFYIKNRGLFSPEFRSLEVLEHGTNSWLVSDTSLLFPSQHGGGHQVTDRASQLQELTFVTKTLQ
jgi:hypothetical protein